MAFDSPRPLVVCGFVRSGTQMCATLLSNSSEVELQSEIPVRLTKVTFQWLKAVKREQQNAPAERFYRLCRAMLRDVTAPADATRRRSARWFGHKTPRHESWFHVYESLFDHPEGRPCYVYCLRDPFLVWRSYRVMPWNARPTVGRFLRGWVKSVRAYETMKVAAPDRVHLFNLSRMLEAPDRPIWLQSTLFDPLQISGDSFRRPVETLENLNSAQAKFGVEPPELPESDIVRIARDRRVRGIVARHFPELESEVARRAALGRWGHRRASGGASGR